MHVKDAKEDVKYLLETGLFLFFYVILYIYASYLVIKSSFKYL